MKIVWAEPRPSADVVNVYNGKLDEYWDVVPIPFYPDDLPRLESDPFGWTPKELQSAAKRARRLLTSQRKPGSAYHRKQHQAFQHRSARGSRGRWRDHHGQA